LTQRISLQAWNTGEDFKPLLLSDPDVQNYLDSKQIEEIFSLNYHLKHVEEIFARVFKK
jgi:adenylosuccinate lyase